MKALSILTMIVILCLVISVSLLAEITYSEELYNRAKDGDAEAQHDLARCYYHGYGITQNYEEAVKWWRLAAEQGYAEAQFNLGVSYAFGEGVRQDYEEAVKRWRLAAEQGNAKAQYNLGLSYAQGKGVTQSYKESVKWFRLAAKQGDAEAQYNLGVCYYQGKGVSQNYYEAVKWLTEAAEQGFDYAQYSLGRRYYFGEGVIQDYEKAVIWFRLAAEQGHAKAQYFLGWSYLLKGEGVEENSNEAAKWWHLAADQGHVDAIYDLGRYYQYWIEGERNFEQAAKWYRLAAEQGHAEAQYDLGSYYARGRGVEEDQKEAVRWYRVAAEQGFAKAQHKLGRCYYLGIGTNKDYQEAIKWFKLAAEQGFVDAHFDLGGLYTEGLGVMRNYYEAYIHYLIVYFYEQHSVHRDIADTAEKKLSLSEVRKAQEEAQRRIDVIEGKTKEKKEPLAVTNNKKEIYELAESEKYISIEKNIPLARRENVDAVAIIIGNKDYHNNIPAVDFALRDALLMRKYVQKTLGYRFVNIIYLENASAAQMRVVFGDRDSPRGQLSDYVKEGVSDVFVFYSGHGVPDPNTKQGYLVPVDGNPDRISLSCYPLELLYDNLNKIEARSVTVVIDACFSGGTCEGEMLIAHASPVRIQIDDPAAKIENGTVITASSGSQLASWHTEKRHGLLTYFFLKGLQGAADYNNDGKITVGEMKRYLEDRNNGVPYYARRLHGRDQMPQVWGRDDTVLR